MLEQFIIDPSWILSIRCDFLNAFFKGFAMITADFLYIPLFALGFWLFPKNKVFKSMGFLFPFTILFNLVIKYTFMIPRPDESLWLTTVSDPMGFPSGGAQLAAVLWGLIYLNIHGKLKYLCWIPIIGIPVSRVYLGVHSIYDVAVGLMVGWATLKLWVKYFDAYFEANNVSRKTLISLGITLLSTLLYFLVAGDQWTKLVPFSIGSLVGFSLSLPRLITSNVKNIERNWKALGVCLVISAVILKFIPQPEAGTIETLLLIPLKYGLLMFVVFGLYSKLLIMLQTRIKARE